MQPAASLAVALSLVLAGCAERPAAKPMEPPLTLAGASGAQVPAAGSGGAPVVVAPVPDAQVVIPDAGPPADALPPVVMEDDAGEWMAPDPVCTDGVWRLAPGFLLARRVDYVADRDTPIVDGGFASDMTFVVSEAGMPCASAMNRERCMAALKLPGGIGRHLMTSAGDTVQLWEREVVMKLLGLIDTQAEALWWLTMQGGYLLPCSVRVETSKDGFRIKGALSTACGETQNATHRPLELLIQPNGTLSDYGPIDVNDPICAWQQ